MTDKTNERPTADVPESLRTFAVELGILVGRELAKARGSPLSTPAALNCRKKVQPLAQRNDPE